MPSIKILTPISGGSYYHIFNRGINRQKIFFSEANYYYFLKLLDKYLSGYLSVLAYSLIVNHFHLIIRVKDKIEIPVKKKGNSEKQKYELASNQEIVGEFVSNQFRKLFITYAMAINIQENRTGSLFDKNFKKIEITDEDYLKYAIFYLHYNPVKHGLVNDLSEFKFSSYNSFIKDKPTKLDKGLVFDIFDGKDGFINYHSVMHDERESVIIE